MLAQQIEVAKQREQIAAWAAGEKAVAETVADLCTATDLAPGDKELLQPWLTWCKDKSVRHAPAKAWCCAAYILDRHKLGATEEQILGELSAITRLHSKFKLSDPVTGPVHAALERIIEIRPPRWPKADQIAWSMLRAQIRLAIATREAQRDKELRRIQNEHAEWKRNHDAAKPVETEKVSN